MFPKLSPAEIRRLGRFGEARHCTAGEALFVTGAIAPGMFVIVSGEGEIKRHDPLGHLAAIVRQGPGEFVAEIGQLAGQPALVDACAVGTVETLLISPLNLRALVIAETELGDRIMRALILRRVTLIESGAGGPVLIGAALSGDVLRLQSFLSRNAYPCQVLDPTDDYDAKTLLHQYGAQPEDLPLAVCPNGSVLRNPSESE